MISLLSTEGSDDLGLKDATVCKVGLGFIDAHAGGVNHLTSIFPLDLNFHRPIHCLIDLV